MWFTNWWEGLTLLQQCFAVVAIPATVILLLQTVLLLFGLGGHDADHGEVDTDHDFDHDMDHDLDHDTDHDFDHDADHDFDHDAHDGAHHAAGIRLFTLRGIVALFAVGGWLGVAMCDLGLSPALAGLIAAAGLSVLPLAFLNSGAVSSRILQDIKWPAVLLAAALIVFTNWVKPTKKWHPIIFIGISAVIGIVFHFAGV